MAAGINCSRITIFITLRAELSKLHVNGMTVITCKPQITITPDHKQLLDKVEHDIMNYENRGLCYLPQPSASADNTDTRF